MTLRITLLALMLPAVLAAQASQSARPSRADIVAAASDIIQHARDVTLLCFDAATSGDVTVLGRGELVTDVREKQRHWKTDWSRIYPGGPRGEDVVLIRVTPTRLEIVSDSRLSRLASVRRAQLRV